MKSQNIDRREFLKIAGTGALGLGAAACSPGKKNTAPAANVDEGPGEMVMRTNNRNGDKVSLLGYGCMRWRMIKGENGKTIVDQENVNELVDHAMANGVNYYDTSPAYLQGQSEAAAGAALSRHPRNSYFIATKLSNFGDGSREASIKMYHDSMEQLRTDYFDYYLCHSIGRGGKRAFDQRYVENGMMDFLMKEREAGRIRNLGFSFHGAQDEFDELLALDSLYHWDFVQIEMNYLDWRYAKAPRNTNAEYLYDELDKKELPIVIMEPLLGGRLANVPENIAARLKERDPEHSVASWAFRFVGTYPRVLTALSGMTNMDVLKDNLNTFRHFRPCSEDDIDFLMKTADMLDHYPTVPCNDCKYCMPCPYGIDIPGIFLHYNKMVNTGQIATSKEQKDYRKLRRQYIISYDRAIESLRQANHCTTCSQCNPHCPQSIDIPVELRRIDSYIEKLKQDNL
ncbi:MAG: aldo/keto reductase [Bacteroidales bacterium]|nr:aldo/keto reductase [Bacteroidales bacterium]